MRSIRAWAALPSSEAGAARIGYNATLLRPVEAAAKGGAMSRSVLHTTVVIMLIVIGTTGCATMQDNPRASIGALGGAAFGGLIAAAAGGGGAAIAGAVIGGALIGGFAGNALDQRDKRLAAEAQQQALESARTGQAVPWSNHETGHTGTITPTKTFQGANG